MKKEKITRWHVLDGLRNNEEIAAYLEAALEDGDKSFDKGRNPNFEMVFKAIDSLGLRLSILPKINELARR